MGVFSSSIGRKRRKNKADALLALVLSPTRVLAFVKKARLAAGFFSVPLMSAHAAAAGIGTTTTTTPTTSELQRHLLDDKQIKALVQRRGASGRSAATIAADWRCFVAGAAAAIVILVVAATFAYSMASWHASSHFRFEPRSLAAQAAAEQAKPAPRPLPVKRDWRFDVSDGTCPWQSASSWLRTMQAEDQQVWARLRDRCSATFEGVRLASGACPDVPPGSDCGTAVERAFWQFAASHVPGSGNRGRYAEKIVIPKVSQLSFTSSLLLRTWSWRSGRGLRGTRRACTARRKRRVSIRSS
jgi:hypothetical protein